VSAYPIRRRVVPPSDPPPQAQDPAFDFEVGDPEGRPPAVDGRKDVRERVPECPLKMATSVDVEVLALVELEDHWRLAWAR
jgi:hypothetical protein